MKQGLVLILSVATLIFASCDTKVVDAEYPDQRVYLPAAAATATENCIYTISQAHINPGSTPTEGSPYQFVINEEEGLFSIPLSVYRSGITNDGKVDVTVWFDEDHLGQMYLDGYLSNDVEILDISFRRCPEAVRIRSGESLASFTIDLDLYYLMDQARYGKKFAFAVAIETADRQVNEDLDKVVILIDTQLFENL